MSWSDSLALVSTSSVAGMGAVNMIWGSLAATAKVWKRARGRRPRTHAFFAHDQDGRGAVGDLRGGPRRHCADSREGRLQRGQLFERRVASVHPRRRSASRSPRSPPGRRGGPEPRGSRSRWRSGPRRRPGPPAGASATRTRPSRRARPSSATAISFRAFALVDELEALPSREGRRPLQPGSVVEPMGTRLMDSTPAPMVTSMAPAITAWATKWMACWAEPHWRSTVVPGTDSGNPAANRRCERCSSPVPRRSWCNPSRRPRPGRGPGRCGPAGRPAAAPPGRWRAIPTAALRGVQRGCGQHGQGSAAVGMRANSDAESDWAPDTDEAGRRPGWRLTEPNAALARRRTLCDIRTAVELTFSAEQEALRREARGWLGRARPARAAPVARYGRWLEAHRALGAHPVPGRLVGRGLAARLRRARPRDHRVRVFEEEYAATGAPRESAGTASSWSLPPPGLRHRGPAGALPAGDGVGDEIWCRA